MRSITYFVASIAATALTVVAVPAPAQTWPSKPIRLIVPFSAGGPSDALGRALGKSLSEGLGQPVIVENKTGAGGSIGMDAVAKAAPDGYTIGMGNTGSNSINPHVYAKMPYQPLTDFAPITPVVSYTNVLVVNPKVPANSVTELVAWSKANPSMAFFASGGTGATNHLSGELLKALTGAPLTHVPYKGNAPAMVDVISGNVAAMFDITTTAIPQIRAGKVKPLAVTSPKRSTYLPNVPTMKEAGIAGYEEAGSELWFGLFAPAGTPQAVIDKLNAATIKAVRSPEMQDAIRGMAYEAWTLPGAEFRTFLQSDLAKWSKVVRLANIKPE
jgi:tripartite-type tricarboxylate transporter receptor subunit TctC